MLDLKVGHHCELGALFDLEGMLFERLLAARRREVDGNWRAARGLHGQGEDDTDSRVAGVGEVFAAT